MKKFIQHIAAVKAVASLAFSALIMVLTVATMLFGGDSVPVSYIWQIIFLSLIYGSLQLAAFSENLFKKSGTPARMLFLGVSMFAALAAFAAIFAWFAVNSAINWLLFAGAYAAVFLVATFALRTVFKISGLKYNQMLAAYKANHDNI